MNDNVTAIEEYQNSKALSLPGVTALAEMTDDEFDQRLTAMKRHIERIKKMQLAIMDEGVDYGVLPGINKPTLYKPGAEKLCEAYQLRSDFTHERHPGDGVTAPNVAYIVRCELHLGNIAGPIVGIGHGAANSWETKHRYRRGQRVCPRCGAVGTIMKSSYKPEWFCFDKKGGCKATFDLNEPSITQQAVGDVENADPWDLENTILKMAEKRAFVDVTLRATASSGIFTQDVEDEVQPDAPPPPKEAPHPPQTPQAAEPPPSAPPVTKNEPRYASQLIKETTVACRAWMFSTIRDKWHLEHEAVLKLLGIESFSKDRGDRTVGQVLDEIAAKVEQKQ